MDKCYYALWLSRKGRQRWAGPFPGNAEARRYLQTSPRPSVRHCTGSMVVSTIAMTPAERREALPLLHWSQRLLPPSWPAMPSPWKDESCG